MPPTLVAQHKWAVWTLIASSTLVRIPAGVALGVVLPALAAELALDPAQQGWLGSALSLPGVLLGIPAAWYLTRFDPRVVQGVVLTIGAGLVFLQGLAPGFAALLLLRLLAGVVFAGLQPAQALLLRQWFTPREMPLVSGARAAAIGVVEAATFALVAPLAVAMGWRAAFQGLGALGAAVAVAWWLFSPPARPGPAEPAASVGGGANPLQLLRRHPALAAMTLGALGAPAAWWAYVVFWPSYMLAQFGMPVEVSGPLFALTSLGMTPGALFVGWLCGRSPGLRGPALVVCGLALAGGSWGMLLTDDVAALLALTSAVGLAWGFIAVMGGLAFQLPGIQPRDTAVASSIIWTCTGFGELLGPALTGTLAVATSSVPVALGVAAALSCLLVVGGVVVRRLPAP